jgi:mannosyltransferase
MDEAIGARMGRSPAAPLQEVWTVRGRLDSLAIAGLTAATLALGLYRSNSTSLWTDELFSVTLAGKPLNVLVRQLWSAEANMALYYLILGAWLHLLSLLGVTHANELVIRIPSVVFAAAAVVVAYFVAKRLFGMVVGFVAAALLLLNYVFLMEVAQARGYSLELFLQLLGWLILIRILENPAKNAGRLGVAFGLVMGLALYANLLSALVIVAQLAAFGALAGTGAVSRERLGKAIRPALIASSTLIVAVAPLAVDVVLHGGANDWIPNPGLREILTFAGALAGASPAFAAILVIGGVLGLGMALRRPEAIDSGDLSLRAKVVLLATWIAVPFILSWGLSHQPFGLHLFLTRYLLVIVPAICCLSAAGLYSISKSRRNVGRVMLAVSVLLAISAVPEYYSRVQREDFRTASAWLAERYQSGDGVACASVACSYALDYYAPGTLQTGAPGNYVWSAGKFDSTPVDPTALAAYAPDHVRIFLVYGTAGQSGYISADEKWLQNHHYALVKRLETVPGSAGKVTVELFERQPG